MLLDATKPTDQALVSELPSYIRALTRSFNTIASLFVPAGSTVLEIGTDLSVGIIEVVLISGIGISTISSIRKGTAGQIKIFVFQDDDIILKDGLNLNGELNLNQLPALSNYSAKLNDVIAFINIDGNGSTIYGYWKELWRMLAVK